MTTNKEQDRRVKMREILRKVIHDSKIVDTMGLRYYVNLDAALTALEALMPKSINLDKFKQDVLHWLKKIELTDGQRRDISANVVRMAEALMPREGTMYPPNLPDEKVGKETFNEVKPQEVNPEAWEPEKISIEEYQKMIDDNQPQELSVEEIRDIIYRNDQDLRDVLLTNFSERILVEIYKNIAQVLHDRIYGTKEGR